VYQEIEAEGPLQLSIAELKKRMAELPPAHLADLEHVTVIGDLHQILACISEFRTHQPAVADALNSLAVDFEFGRILTLVQEAKKHNE
jgi:hypothetical protein